MERTPIRLAACLNSTILVLLALALAPALAADEAAERLEIVPTDYVVLPAVGQYGRLPLHRDAVEAELVAGTWTNPSVGDSVEGLDGERETWRSDTASDGTLDTASLRGGYAFATFEAPADGVMLLEAAGHAAVYVNGEPHTGDPYRLGWLKLPVRVKKGANTLLFHLAAEKLAARLTPPIDQVFFLDDDRTLPTLVRGESKPVWGAIPIINATADWLSDLRLECRREEGDSASTPVAPIPPLSIRTLPIKFPAATADAGDSVGYTIHLTHGDQDEPLAETGATLKRAGPRDLHVRTFRSRIDGSVQPYAVRPAETAGTAESDRPGILVALHGAGETCEDHVAKYAPKKWAHVVAPQGRRPYGFDWEAWGRIDAIEALDDARDFYEAAPRRTFLTGKAMGGHGVWHIGATYPNEFRAIGPSDGWISFWSYGGGMPSFENPTSVEAMMLRGYATSDTLEILSNLANTGIYVLHDPAEDDVPVEQARYLREELAAFHPNFVYYEAAVGNDDGDGNDSPRMMDFFEHSPTRRAPALIDFTTADPGVSAESGWVTIDAQQALRVPSRVVVHRGPSGRTYDGETSNVARLAIRIGNPAEPTAEVTLDEQSLTKLNQPDGDAQLWFERIGDRWMAADRPTANVKNARRSGTFNAAIDNDVLLVYGTQGSDEENRWAETKARLDAETFYYRGGGAIEVLTDDRFKANEDKDRSLILYGNADTNGAWAEMLPDCPVEVNAGQVRVGDRTETGDDLAVVMVRPRPGSETALVGIVGGTGPAGMRLTNRLRWYVSGIVYPDLMILGPKILTEGTSDVRAWGYFGPAWGLDDAEIAWRDPAP